MRVFVLWAILVALFVVTWLVRPYERLERLGAPPLVGPLASYLALATWLFWPALRPDLRKRCLRALARRRRRARQRAPPKP